MKTLPPNIHAPDVEATVLYAKQVIGSFACDMVTHGHGGSPRALGAMAMMALLDATLEHWLVWHRAQRLPFDQEAFFALARERLVIADANVSGYRSDAGSGVVQ